MRRQTLAALAIVPVLALGLTACGDRSGGAGGKGTTKAASDLAAMRAFAKCMREQGVDMPDPSSDGSGRVVMKATGASGNPADMEKKMKAAEPKCRHLQPNGGKPQGKPNPADLAKMRAFAKCMREHGVDMPDPSTDGAGLQMHFTKGDGRSNTGPDPSSQVFKDADKACRQYAPGKGGGPVLNGGPARGGS